MSQVISSEVARVMFQIFLDAPYWRKRPAHETAILVLPGIYQEYRIIKGVGLWPDHGEYLWVAGTRGDPAYSREQIIEVAGVDSPNIICGGFANHTPDQMQWCCRLLEENPQVKHVIVTTAAYHVPRCALTLLAALEKARKWVMITPVPLPNPSGDSFSPDSSEDFQYEAEKIEKYQQTGDVASFDQWRRYLKQRIYEDAF